MLAESEAHAILADSAILLASTGGLLLPPGGYGGAGGGESAGAEPVRLRLEQPAEVHGSERALAGHGN